MTSLRPTAVVSSLNICLTMYLTPTGTYLFGGLEASVELSLTSDDSLRTARSTPPTLVLPSFFSRRRCSYSRFSATGTPFLTLFNRTVESASRAVAPEAGESVVAIAESRRTAYCPHSLPSPTHPWLLRTSGAGHVCCLHINYIHRAGVQMLCYCIRCACTHPPKIEALVSGEVINIKYQLSL